MTSSWYLHVTMSLWRYDENANTFFVSQINSSWQEMKCSFRMHFNIFHRNQFLAGSRLLPPNHKPQIIQNGDDVIKWKTFSVTGPSVCGEFTCHRWIPLTKAIGAELWCFYDLHLNKQLSKQSRRRWFETPSRPLWRHCHDISYSNQVHVKLKVKQL